MDAKLRELIGKLEAQRKEAMELLMGLTDEQLSLAHTLGGTGGEEGPDTIRRQIQRIATHHLDHSQHIVNARRAIGVPRSETVRALVELQLARTELVTNLIGLSDEDLERDCSEGEEVGNLRPRRGQELQAMRQGIQEHREVSPQELEGVVYTIGLIVEHVVLMEEMRLGRIRQALAEGRAG